MYLHGRGWKTLEQRGRNGFTWNLMHCSEYDNLNLKLMYSWRHTHKWKTANGRVIIISSRVPHLTDYKGLLYSLSHYSHPTTSLQSKQGKYRLFHFTDEEAEVWWLEHQSNELQICFHSTTMVSSRWQWTQNGIFYLSIAYLIPMTKATALNSSRKTSCILGLEAAVQSPSYPHPTVSCWRWTTDLVELSLGIKESPSLYTLYGCQQMGLPSYCRVCLEQLTFSPKAVMTTQLLLPHTLKSHQGTGSCIVPEGAMNQPHPHGQLGYLSTVSLLE